MGADIKQLRTRIKSVDSTLHLTSAMGLVASSKIRKANLKMAQSRDYSAAFEKVVAALAAVPECRKSPYISERESGKTVLIAIAGDRGLAGGYNANVFRFLRQYTDAEIIPIGKRACERFSGKYTSSEHFSVVEADEFSKSLCERFVSGELMRVGIVYTRYVSMMSQVPEVKWILPLKASGEKINGMIFEPDEETVLESAVSDFVSGSIVACVRESFASETAARRMAMDSAGKNAKKMIDDLQLEYNRARQGAITQEITEIVAGSGE